MSCSAAISSSHEEELHRLGQKNKRLRIQLHKQNINSIQVPAWQQPRNIVHLSYHKHDRFHCDFSFSIIGNIYVAPGPFCPQPSRCGRRAPRHGAGPGSPAALTRRRRILHGLGPRRRARRRSRRSQMNRGGNFFHSLFLSPTLAVATEGDTRGWKAQRSSVRQQHLDTGMSTSLFIQSEGGRGTQ